MASMRLRILERLLAWRVVSLLWTVFLRERPRYLLAWAAALVGTTIYLFSGWIAQRNPSRADGNHGHVSFDFSGQWLMGRLLVRGEGRFLYDRRHLRAALEQAYPREDEDPEQDTHDAEMIMRAMMGSDDPPEPGGALYPPINALVYAPLGLLSPRIAYRLAQVACMLFLFVAAGGMCLLARGRVWWPVAAMFVMVFPGMPGAMALGQNAPLSLAILVWAWLLAARGWDGWGGAVWGLLAFKPVWAASFFLALVLTRRWQMAGGMLLAATALAALTLPFVGWQSWIDWLHIGRDATRWYNVDTNWIELSRDLLNVPRRWLTDFTIPSEQRDPDALAPTLIGWTLLLAVLETTTRLTWPRSARPAPVEGPGAAFVLLGAWLTCFHFMYYDSLLAALPVFLIFTEPRRYWEPLVAWLSRHCTKDKDALAGDAVGEGEAPAEPALRARREPRPPELFHPSADAVKVGIPSYVAPIVVLLMLVTQPFWYIDAWRKPPGETFWLLALWFWCGWRWLRDEPSYHAA